MDVLNDLNSTSIDPQSTLSSSSSTYPTPNSAATYQQMSENTEMVNAYGCDIADGCLEDGKDKSKYSTGAVTGRLRGRRALRDYAVLILSLFFVVDYVIPKVLQSFSAKRSWVSDEPTGVVASNVSNLVPLEAHIMSKCPDARDCLRDLIVPAMEQVVDKVDFKLSYIGSITEDDTIHCKHGSTECLGNMLGLCAADLFPTDVRRSLGFSTCLILSYKQIPSRELVEQCALEHGIPFDDLNACVSEEGKGLDLLEASMKRSQKAGVENSCTVRVAGEKWCRRDGAEWEDCPDGHMVKDLVRAVEEQRKSS
ncbi:MAG: hypothetical protein Q9163_000953 [Psora crenata]